MTRASIRQQAVPALFLAATFLASALLTSSGTFANQVRVSTRGDSVALQPGGTEAFLFDLPEGWKLGTQEGNKVGQYLEWTPADQSVDDWRDLIAIHVYPALAALPPSDYLTRMADRLADLCDFLMTTDMISAPVNGFPGARRVLACTRDKSSGKGEVTMIRVVTGKEALYVLLRAWRRPAFTAPAIPVSNAELVASRKLLDRGLPCHKGTPERPCPEAKRDLLGGPDSKRPLVALPVKPEAPAAAPAEPKAAPPAAEQAKTDEKAPLPATPAAAPAAPAEATPEVAPEVAQSKAEMAEAAEELRPENRKRLQMLDRLRARNLITEEAYQEKRRAILHE